MLSFEPIAGLLMSRISWDSRFVRFLSKKPWLVVCHYCGFVLFFEVLLLFVEVDEFLVQRLIERLEILRTSHDIAVIPEPILSSADTGPAYS